MHFFDNMLTFEWRLFYTCVATFIINLPFGYIRGGFRKLSFWWFVAIHAPVPLVIIIRKFHDLELTWILAPFLLGSFFMGQFAGRKIYSWKPYRRGNSKKQMPNAKCQKANFDIN